MPAIATSSWAPARSGSTLPAGAVEVWWADLGACGDRQRRTLLANLDEPERARAASFRRREAGVHWGLGRALLRVLLAQYLECEPRSLQFVFGDAGKPALHAEQLSFNVSHSGAMCVYGFAAGGEIGVDLELVHDTPRRLPQAAIARRAFGADEARRIAALDPAIREAEFLRAWTRLEAERKCVGAGLAEAGPNAAAGSRGASAPWIAEFALGDKAVGALAATAPLRSLRQREWQRSASR